MIEASSEPGSERLSRHPHAAPDRTAPKDFDVVVVGGGHAGIEAALAAARLGVHVALVSFDADKVGEMSCNPAIGGLGKGQMVREIDALGGVMAQVADATGIQFRMLNTAKGAAVRAPRCQSDRHRYREVATQRILDHPAVDLIEGAAVGLVLGDPASKGGRPSVHGVRLEGGRVLRAPATIMTTGTFLRAIMHTGETITKGGRVDEPSADGLTGDVEALGLRLGRLKTGTPPRIDAKSVDFSVMEEQPGDDIPKPFSYLTDPSAFPKLTQAFCHITHTNSATHDIIRDNIHRAPMYMGAIAGVGPRYCPAVEDKIMRFPDRDRHQVFVEPEGLDTDVLYINGVSTSLPAEIQESFMHTIPGLESAKFLRHGYAVEYDFVQPSQLSDTLALQDVPGLFLAGQINGTSGYEEAAGQGLIAGSNAALWIQDRAPFVLKRHEAYLGVMVDDLVITNPREPYRMFSSRAEYRLLLRQDNADRRLVPLAVEAGLVDRSRLEAVEAKEAAIAHAKKALSKLRDKDNKALVDVLRRPEETFASVTSALDAATLEKAGGLTGLSPEVEEAVEIDVKYEGYIERQQMQIDRLARQEAEEIPRDLDYEGLQGLASEAREKLIDLRPRTLGAASRIEGVRPNDVALIGIQLQRLR